MRYYYAAYHAYGIEFCNDYIMLYRFGTKAERNAYVENANYDESGMYGGYRTETVTRDEARRQFPDAFRTVGDFHDTCDMRDWHGSDEYDYWCTSNLYEW